MFGSLRHKYYEDTHTWDFTYKITTDQFRILLQHFTDDIREHQIYSLIVCGCPTSIYVDDIENRDLYIALLAQTSSDLSMSSLIFKYLTYILWNPHIDLENLIPFMETLLTDAIEIGRTDFTGQSINTLCDICIMKEICKNAVDNKTPFYRKFRCDLFVPIDRMWESEEDV